MRLLLISGSLRAGSTNTALLRTAAVLARDAVLLDGVAALPHFSPDLDAEGAVLAAPVVALREQLAQADAALLCTPEYAGALPAAFKNVLEWAVGSGELSGKPVAWVNAAGPAAPNGGHDAHDSLRKVLGWIGASIVEDACARLPLERHQVGADGLIAGPVVRDELLRVLAALAAAVDAAAAG